ncbi:DinB family protein [Tessaracoccus sp. SD287]|uniref:DinB family protein n=1 Tax=Tessaracoccus sp. SD287 TaxID=2782008 RepID=UPI001A95F3E4|nr:DinB family protein [Tessaracoccus sp. SD287]MBO1030577.1 DinB family protein [Tessaracoccus sp. SD287]
MDHDGQVELLLRYLQAKRDALLWKLEGLSEYDARRPLTPTGSNVLGIVKHVASVEHDYLSVCFGDPPAFPMPWNDSEEPNADMYATAEESVTDIIGLYRTAWERDDASVRRRGLAATGRVPWWGERGQQVEMFWVLVHVLDETARHLGQVDILRESIDGQAGVRPEGSNLPELDAQGWSSYVDMLEQLARRAGDEGLPAASP